MTDEDGKVTSYIYDDSNWLTQVAYSNGQVIKDAYNDAGDRLSEQVNNDATVTSTYDAAGRLLSRGSDIFAYDTDGNLINAVEGSVPASYTWNSDNRLTMVSRVHNGCKHDKDRNGYGYGHLKHGSSFVEYEKYDYLPEDWRRITRTAGVQTAKNKNKAVEEEVFISVYDGSDESHEYRLTAGKATPLQLEQVYVSEPGTDDMTSTVVAGRVLSMLKDGLGSTVALTSNDGMVLAKIGYDAWGRFFWPAEAEDSSFDSSKDGWLDYLNRLEKTRSFGRHNAWAFGRQFADKLTPYLYTGRRFSAMTGGYWNRHRYYSPALGRFTTKDPIGFNGGYNLYRYADNNPMRFTDPMGLFKFYYWASENRSRYGYFNTNDYYLSSFVGNSSIFIEALTTERGAVVHTVNEDLFPPEAIYCMKDFLIRKGYNEFENKYPNIAERDFIGTKYFPISAAATKNMRIFAPVVGDTKISNAYIQYIDTYDLVPSAPYFSLEKQYNLNLMDSEYEILDLQGTEDDRLDYFLNELHKGMGINVKK